MVLKIPGGLFKQSDVRETPISESGELSVGDFCSVYRNSAFSVQATEKDIDWNAEEYDDDGMHSTSVDPERIIVTTPGLYLIHFECYFTSSITNSDGTFKLYENATVIDKKIVYQAENAINETMCSMTTIRKVTSNVYYKVTAKKSHASNLNIKGDATMPSKLIVIRIK